VIKLVLSVLSALALTLSPVAVNAASVGQGPMAGCDMQQKMPATPVNHGKMDCCTSACQVTSAALFARRDVTADQPSGGKELHASLAMKRLDSFAPNGLDPPPRL
jgi:hypothetical protein